MSKKQKKQNKLKKGIIHRSSKDLAQYKHGVKSASTTETISQGNDMSEIGASSSGNDDRIMTMGTTDATSGASRMSPLFAQSTEHLSRVPEQEVLEHYQSAKPKARWFENITAIVVGIIVIFSLCGAWYYTYILGTVVNQKEIESIGKDLTEVKKLSQDNTKSISDDIDSLRKETREDLNKMEDRINESIKLLREDVHQNYRKK